MKKNILLAACLISVCAISQTVQAACTKDGFCDRPIKMGVSISNTTSAPFIYAGTAGMRVRAFSNPDRKFILSNNHVLGAGGPDICPNEADIYPPPMTWALQPGTLDLGFDPGNDPTYLAGVDFNLVPIDFTPGAQNIVDAAIAFTTPTFASAEILGIGQPNPALGFATVGMPITKSGRTTGVTTGTVLAVNASVNVNYGSCGTASYIKQVITSAGLGDSGDSGSVVLEQGTNTPVGLYFAGSATIGIMNPILDVYMALKVFADTDGPVAVASEADLLSQAAALPVDQRIEILKKIQARHQAGLLAVKGVRGVGIGLDDSGTKHALVVFGEKITAALRRAVPRTIEGVPVRLIESGVLVAH